MKSIKTAGSILFLLIIAFLSIQGVKSNHKNKISAGPAEEYVCTPCGANCDTRIYHEPGSCTECNMPLVKKSTVNIKNIQPSELGNYIDRHPGVILLDVRSKDEFEGTVQPDYGTLKNAINIPLGELQDRLPAIENLKDKEIIVYCSHSHRSPQAAYLLMQNGFTKVMNMAGGMSAFTDNSYKKNNSVSAQPQTFPVSSAAEDQLKSVETAILSAAYAMPESKYDFTPESMNIEGTAFKGVRTFAGQIKHLATDNFHIWSPITGDPVRADITDVNGPASIKSKEDIIKYLKESFALGHKAIATLTSANAMDMLSFRGSKLSRLELAFYAIVHDNDHYGQMVVYLRMQGIVPGMAMPK